jgi:hypothetical protein
MGNPKNYNDTNPAAPAGASNVKWQAVAPDPNPDVPRDVSAYMPPMTATVGGAVPTPPNDSTQVLRGNGTWGAGGSGASISSVQQEAYVYSADTGAANAYVVTLSPVPTIITGSEVLFKAAHANTGASTIAVNGGSATAIKKNGTIDLASGDIVVGQIVALSFDGTNYQMTSPAVSTSSGTLASDSDVTISSPTDKDILAYKTADSKWENRTASALGLELTANKDVASGYAGLDGASLLKTTEFPALTGDVTTVAGAVSCTVVKINGTAVKAGMTPSDGDVLSWVAANSDWENSTLTSLGNANASQLRGNNIATTAPFDGQLYRWSAANSAWEPSTGSIPAYSLQADGSAAIPVSGAQGPMLWSYSATTSTGVVATGTEISGITLATGTANPSASLVQGRASSTTAGNISLGIHRSIKWRIALTQTTNCRMWLGLGSIFAASPAYVTDTPAAAIVGFRYSAGVDTKWSCVTQTGATHQTVNQETTASHVDTNTHDFEIRWDGVNAIFLIDGTQVGSQNGNIPATTTLFLAFATLDNKTSAAIQSFTFHRCGGYWKWTD